MEAATIAKGSSCWRKFRELLPSLTKKGLSLHSKGKLYAACIRSVMLWDCETWAIKKKDEQRPEHNEMRMLRWMCKKFKNRKVQ